MTDPYTGPRKVRVIDFETTGTEDDDAAEVIEMGRIDLDMTGLTVCDPWTSFAFPMDGIPPVTRAVHHIRDDEVAGAPPARELWDHLFADLADDEPLCAHNAKFERHFVPPDYRDRPWIDTYKVALMVWPDAPTHSNQGLRYWLGVDNQTDFDRLRAEPVHRALPDSYVTAFILRELLKVKSIPEMIQISSYPAVLRRINFGKHKGMLYADAPTDYLEWLRDKSEMGEDVKFTARRELQIRRKAQQ